MSNNAPDYNDNLAFEPKMTWEEFVKKYGDGNGMFINRIDYDDVYIKRLGEDKHITFWEDGQVAVTYSHNGYESRIILAENRTPEQMEAIIEALRG